MKKRMLTFLGAGVLAATMLTGCGTPKADQLINGMFDNTFDSATINVTAEADVEADVDGEDYSLKANADFEILASGLEDTENAIAYVDGQADYNFAGFLKDKQKIEAYYDGENSKTYINQDGDWYYTTNDDVKESTGVELSKKEREKIFDAFKEFLAEDAVVGKKTVKIGKEECYVLSVVPKGEHFIDFLETVADVTDTKDSYDEMIESIEDELDVEAAELVDKFGVTFDIYVSKKNKYCVAIKADLSTFDIEGILEVAGMDMDDLSDKIGVEIDEIKINALNFNIECTEINDTEVEIPSKVEKNAEELSAGSDDDYDWDSDTDDDDYDYGNDDGNDDDYGYDDGNDDDNNVTSSGDRYDDTEFSLYDYGDNYITTFKLPDGFEYSYVEDDGTYYSIVNSSNDKITFYCSADYDILNYVEDGTIPEDNDYYKDYSFEKYEFKRDGMGPIIQLVETYTYDGEEEFKNILLVKEYTTYYDTKSYIQITLDLYNGWTGDEVTAFVDALAGN